MFHYQNKVRIFVGTERNLKKGIMALRIEKLTDCASGNWGLFCCGLQKRRMLRNRYDRRNLDGKRVL